MTFSSQRNNFTPPFNKAKVCSGGDNGNQLRANGSCARFTRRKEEGTVKCYRKVAAIGLCYWLVIRGNNSKYHYHYCPYSYISSLSQVRFRCRSSISEGKIINTVTMVAGNTLQLSSLLGIIKGDERSSQLILGQRYSVNCIAGRNKLGHGNAYTRSLVQLWCRVGLELVGLSALDPLSGQEKWRRLAGGSFEFTALYL